MKTTFVSLLLILTGTIVSQAQTFAEVFEEEAEIVWLGLDFSETKMLGARDIWGDKTPQQMYEAWNQLMVDQAAKFNIADALHKEQNKVKNSVQIALEHNKNLTLDDSNVFKDAYKEESVPEFRLSDNKLNSIIKSYDFKDNKGIGFMIIMETLHKHKTKPNVTMWITFINLETKELLFVQHITSFRPEGFGVRNYWASSVYNVLTRIRKIEYKSWSKSYKKKRK